MPVSLVKAPQVGLTADEMNNKDPVPRPAIRAFRHFRTRVLSIIMDILNQRDFPTITLWIPHVNNGNPKLAISGTKKVVPWIPPHPGEVSGSPESIETGHRTGDPYPGH